MQGLLGITLLKVHQAEKGTEFPKKQSFIQICPDDLLISAIKKAESEDSLVIRIYNPWDKHIKAVLTMFKEIKAAYYANLLEEKLQEIKPENNQLHIEIKPFEIITLLVEF